MYSRRREAHIKYPGPDDDVRENIINYDDEGGGEDDMTAFDITPLQIPIGGPMSDLANCKMPIMCKCFRNNFHKQRKYIKIQFQFPIYRSSNDFRTESRTKRWIIYR